MPSQGSLRVQDQKYTKFSINTCICVHKNSNSHHLQTDNTADTDFTMYTWLVRPDASPDFLWNIRFFPELTFHASRKVIRHNCYVWLSVSEHEQTCQGLMCGVHCYMITQLDSCFLESWQSREAFAYICHKLTLNHIWGASSLQQSSKNMVLLYRGQMWYAILCTKHFLWGRLVRMVQLLGHFYFVTLQFCVAARRAFCNIPYNGKENLNIFGNWNIPQGTNVGYL